jgi:predicted transcriptional regulator
MTTRTLTVNLSEEIYRQLQERARSAAQPVDAVVVQALTKSFAVEEQLPPMLRDELDAMEHLSDEALWAIARSVASPDTLAMYDLLIERKQEGALTPEGQHWLEQVAQDTDYLMVRKAQAYVLLKQRGHGLPSLDQLHAPTP